MEVRGTIKMLLHSIVSLLFIRCVSSYPAHCLLLSGDERHQCIKASTLQSKLRRHYLHTTNTRCNDGTPAGYYLRTKERSTTWVVYLEGGSFCYDERSCVSRMHQSSLFSITSSTAWNRNRHGDGLLSTSRRQNPNFWNANHVYVPYCSSDFWIGNTTRDTSSGSSIHFHGWNIILEVIKNLMVRGLNTADQLILAGSSAGGIGVLQNIERVSKYIKQFNPNIKIGGLLDSSWFLDLRCSTSDTETCFSQLKFKEATTYWGAIVDSSCQQKLRKRSHKCLFAHKILPSIKTPIFVFQWMYDTAQILGDNKDLESNPEKMFDRKYMRYIIHLGNKMRKTLKHIRGRKHGIFAASCISHTALTGTSTLNSIRLEDKTLNDALKCWLKSLGNDEKKCRKLIDQCNFMQCHQQCPPIYNPLSGEEVVAGEQVTFNLSSSSSSLFSGRETKHMLKLVNRFFRELQEG